jgi:nitroreductase
MATTQKNSEKNVAPWLVKEQDFPTNGTHGEQMEFLLRYAVLAPSFYNSQPWKFAIDEKDEVINLYVNKKHWLKVADPNKRELYISIGCALENLLIAGEHFHLGNQVVYFPDTGNDDWVARVRLVTQRESQAPKPPELFQAIPQRHTNHHSYEGKPILEDQLSKLEEYVNETEYDVSIHVSIDPDIGKQIAKLVAHGDNILYANDKFCTELSNWYGKGIYGHPWFIDDVGKLATKDPQLGKSIAKQESKIINSAPVFAVLTARHDRPIFQVRTGQAFERITLEASLMGIQVYPMFQLMELPEMQSRMGDLFPDASGTPQLVFTMGYAEQEKELTPRLPVEEVLM